MVSFKTKTITDLHSLYVFVVQIQTTEEQFEISFYTRASAIPLRTSRGSRTNKLERFITVATNETISVRITDITLRSPQYSLVYGPSLAGPNYSLKKQSSVFVPGFLLLPRYPYLRWSMKRKKLTA